MVRVITLHVLGANGIRPSDPVEEGCCVGVAVVCRTLMSVGDGYAISYIRWMKASSLSSVAERDSDLWQCVYRSTRKFR